jgi:hypothetical protein
MKQKSRGMDRKSEEKSREKVTGGELKITLN